MNNTLNFIRYALSILVAALAAKDAGPGGALGAFFVFHAIWGIAEEQVAASHKRYAERQWRKRNGL